MAKLFYKILIYFFIFILILIFYLSYFGIKTNSFNNLISNKIGNINSQFVININDVYIKLYPKNFELKLTTDNPEVKLKNNKIKIKNITSTISFKSLILNKKSIKNINIESEENNIISIIKFYRVFENNIQIMLAEKFINNGECYFKINLNFDEEGKLEKDFQIKGYVKNVNLSYKKTFLNTNFDFILKKNKYFLNNSKFEYNKINFESNNIIIEKKKNNFYNFNGDINSNNTKINLKTILKKNKIIFKNIKNDVLKIDTKSKISFDFDKKFKIKNFNSSSDILNKNLKYLVNNNEIKKVLELKNNEIEFTNNKVKILIKGDPRKDNSNIEIIGESIINIKDIEDRFSYQIKSLNQKKDIVLNLDIKNNPLNLILLDYEKKKGKHAKINLNFNLDKINNIFVKELKLIEGNNKFLINNLELSNKLDLEKIENLSLSYVNKNEIKNKINLIYNNNNNIYKIYGDTFDATNLINNILDKDDNNTYLKNISNIVNLNIKKIYLDKNNFILNSIGTISYKSGKVIDLEFVSIFPNKELLKINIKTNKNSEKITTLKTSYPKPLVSRYKFIKGFEEGKLDFKSIKKSNISNSVLIIDNFKVKEVPALAKILTLASLQGIADLLTGEGIRFTDFEMKFSNKNDLMNIEEIYAIGPAISLLMNGYIEKNKLVSLRGTLVPATTINRTISSIPLLGDILVGKKVGEGVFGVSFKIKGEPNNLKTSVNPLKTLTPRFITRTLEKLKN